MKRSSIVAMVLLMCAISAQALDFNRLAPKAVLSLKVPGNNAIDYPLNYVPTGTESYKLTNEQSLPIDITLQNKPIGDDKVELIVRLKADENLYFQLNQTITVDDDNVNSQFYLPGFWYRRNLRSPENAPSFHTSQDWTVREDRLSSPLSGVYNEKSKSYTSILRIADVDGMDALTTHQEGETILSGKTTLGYVGFANSSSREVQLCFGFPYQETPRSYLRKLTLAPAVRAYQQLKKGETITLRWVIKQGKATSFSDFVATTWHTCFDELAPQPMAMPYSTEKMKKEISNYFKNSFVDKYPLKYYSGVHLEIDKCENHTIAEVGFVGRTLLNAYNAMEYANESNREDLRIDAEAIFDSYLELGFTPDGFFKEVVINTVDDGCETLSIRRQSEGAYAMLYYLQYERERGVEHPEWEEKIKQLVDNILILQNKDGSFPRKFKGDNSIIDVSGGSTPCATIPLVMAYTYFKDKRYLESAKKSAIYLEKNIISQADYFSSTLDANCEDKEAAIYAATATYYLSLVTTGKERSHYISLCREASYFALSWYYLWDVPFAQGQMLGDLGFKSRGWGNVSVENNHVDVYVFEFASILHFLSNEYNEPSYQYMAELISSSMRQLLPIEGNLCGIAKSGYYPEVVQHTRWDYGRNGKGYYNLHFAPGWVVASLWELLSPGRIENYFIKKQK